ncbi:MAG TPA: arabinan endo-1,5-alpha-L-arabinosidase [Fimbriimonadaceae bacterium]|jgi:arabinan endo-1,5-alpha-L-arabinosidase
MISTYPALLALFLLAVQFPVRLSDGTIEASNTKSSANVAQNPTTDASAFPFDGFVPENGFDVHDPAIIDFNGHYICFSTSGNGFGVIRTSNDLIHWKVHGPIIRETPEWLRKAIPQHHSIWAPEARRFGADGLRVYYCASRAFGHNTSYIGVAQCDKFDPDNPTEGWHDLGLVISSDEQHDNFNAIDPSTVLDRSGRLWMYFGSYWSGLYVVELDPQTGKLKNPDNPRKVLIARNTEDKANGLEAPSSLYKDGFYYLFVSYGLAAAGVRSTYHIVVGRSATPDGPFTDSTGKGMVDGGHEDFLNSSYPMFGPGGQTPFQDSKGRWLIALHYYNGTRVWYGHVWGKPTLQVREILWGQDGWPLPGLPVTPETVALQNHKLKSVVGMWVHQVDFGEPQRLEIKKDGTCVLNGKLDGTWKVTDSSLELKWPGDSATDFWTDSLVLGYENHYYAGRNQTRLLIRGYRLEGGN